MLCASCWHLRDLSACPGVAEPKAAVRPSRTGVVGVHTGTEDHGGSAHEHDAPSARSLSGLGSVDWTDGGRCGERVLGFLLAAAFVAPRWENVSAATKGSADISNDYHAPCERTLEKHDRSSAPSFRTHKPCSRIGRVYGETAVAGMTGDQLMRELRQGTDD